MMKNLYKRCEPPFGDAQCASWASSLEPREKEGEKGSKRGSIALALTSGSASSAAELTEAVSTFSTVVSTGGERPRTPNS